MRVVIIKLAQNFLNNKKIPETEIIFYDIKYTEVLFKATRFYV